MDVVIGQDVVVAAVVDIVVAVARVAVVIAISSADFQLSAYLNHYPSSS